jgi:hypothetical protein
VTISASQKTVTTGAALELTDGTAATINQSYEIVVTNHDTANPVYLGPSGVTSSTGMKLAAGSAIGISLSFGERLYAIATGGSCTVGVLQSKF